MEQLLQIACKSIMIFVWLCATEPTEELPNGSSGSRIALILAACVVCIIALVILVIVAFVFARQCRRTKKQVRRRIDTDLVLAWASK